MIIDYMEPKLTFYVTIFENTDTGKFAYVLVYGRNNTVQSKTIYRSSRSAMVKASAATAALHEKESR
jgi:hypothetical protein